MKDKIYIVASGFTFSMLQTAPIQAKTKPGTWEVTISAHCKLPVGDAQPTPNTDKLTI